MTAGHSGSSWTIHLAVDGSEHSLAAARLLHDLPLAPGSLIEPLAVLTPRQVPGKAALLYALEAVQEILRGSQAEVRAGLLHGQPAEAIVRYAGTQKPDLIVVGAKGLRATLGILLGGVAQQLVEYARWPVLVVRAPYAGLQRVLLVVDGSVHSAHATTYLTTMPLAPGAAVHAVHVLPPVFAPTPIVDIDAFGLSRLPPAPMPEAERVAEEQEQHEQRAGQELLERTAAELRAAGLATDSELLRGDAATEILQYAAAHDLQLIVAGSRGLGAVEGWLLGSVSRKLVHYATCSVLLVK